MPNADWNFINDLIEAALTDGHIRGTCLIPGGDYYPDEPLPAYQFVDYFGDGMGATRISGDHDGSTWDFNTHPTINTSDTEWRPGSFSRMSVGSLGQGGAFGMGTSTLVECLFDQIALGCGNLLAAIKIQGQLCTFRRIRTFLNLAEGGLFGHSAFDVEGQVNTWQDIYLPGAVRTDYADGSPVLDIRGSGHHMIHPVHPEPTFVNGTHGSIVRVREPLLYAGSGGYTGEVFGEPHFTGDGHITDDIAFDFEDSLITSPRVGFIGHGNGKMRIGPNCIVDISQLDTYDSPRENIIGDGTDGLIDDSSALRLGLHISDKDPGWRNMPNVSYQSIYNRGTGRFLDEPPRTTGGDRTKYPAAWTGPTGQLSATVSTISSPTPKSKRWTKGGAADGRVYLEIPISGVVDFAQMDLTGPAGGYATVFDQSDLEVKMHVIAGWGSPYAHRPGASLTMLKVYVYGPSGVYTLQGVSAFQEAA